MGALGAQPFARLSVSMRGRLASALGVASLLPPSEALGAFVVLDDAGVDDDEAGADSRASLATDPSKMTGSEPMPI